MDMKWNTNKLILNVEGELQNLPFGSSQGLH